MRNERKCLCAANTEATSNGTDANLSALYYTPQRAISQVRRSRRRCPRFALWRPHTILLERRVFPGGAVETRWLACEPTRLQAWVERKWNRLYFYYFYYWLGLGDGDPEQLWDDDLESPDWPESDGTWLLDLEGGSA